MRLSLPVFITFSCVNLFAADWSTFLGPTYNAVSEESDLIESFDGKKPPVLWEFEKGEGYAAASVVGGNVLLFHRVGGEEVLECLKADSGERVWRFAYPTTYKDRYNFSSGPRCQPVSDGELVYLFGAQAHLHCLDLKTGKLLWKRDFMNEFQLKTSFFGVAATPLISGDKLILNIGIEGGPNVIALDCRTGKRLWGVGGEWGMSYASPIPATVHGEERVFVFAGGESRPATGGLIVIDPEKGEEDCRFPWRGKRYESVNGSSPVVVNNQVYIAECYGAGGVLLNLKEDGSCEEAWRSPALQTHFMTAVYKDGYLYGMDGHGPMNCPLVCIEWATGKEMWRANPEWETPLEDGRNYTLMPALASLLLVDDRCLMLGQYGHLVWLDLNPEVYKELDRTHLFLGRQTWALPTLSDGRLYVCQNDKGVDGTSTRLICYDLRK